MRSVKAQIIWFLILGPGLFVAALAGNELYGWLLVRHELKLCREAGMELDPAKLVPPPVPDDQNAAPLYLKALAEMRTKEASAPAAVKAALECFPAVPSEGFFEKPEWRRQAQVFLNYYQPVMELTDEAARKAACRFPDEQYVGFTEDIFSPSNSIMYCRGWRTMMVVYVSGAEEGYLSAVQDLKVAREIMPNGCLGNLLGKRVLLWRVLHDLQLMLQTGPPPRAATARAVLRALPDEAEVRRWIHAAGSGQVIDMTQREFPEQRRQWLRLTRIADRQNEASALRCCRLICEHGGRPGAPAEVRTWPADHPYFVTRREPDRRYPFPWHRISWAGIGEGQLSTAAEALAEAQLVRVALLLELYGQEHGEYPEKREGLRITAGGSVPLDPYDGQPMRYRREGDGYRIWSVGKNLKDDGGVSQEENYERLRDAEGIVVEEDYDSYDLVMVVNSAARAVRKVEHDKLFADFEAQRKATGAGP